MEKLTQEAKAKEAKRLAKNVKAQAQWVMDCHTDILALVAKVNKGGTGHHGIRSTGYFLAEAAEELEHRAQRLRTLSDKFLRLAPFANEDG